MFCRLLFDFVLFLLLMCVFREEITQSTANFHLKWAINVTQSKCIV